MENLVIKRSFWQGKKVFVTGHTGFKGSWLSLWLQELGADVSGYALPPPTTPSLFELACVGSGMTSLEGDVRDFGCLSTALERQKPEIVIHMAAQAIVRHSYENPIDTFSSNVMGTVCLLESVRNCKSVRAVICVTSDKCYENHEWVWGYRENEAMGGHDPYSSSKGCSELVVASYRKSFFPNESYDRHGVALASVRAGNVIGGGDWAQDRLVPDTIRAFLESRSVVIRNPHAIRPWQHALEPLCGYLILAEKLFEFGPEFAEAWNFGPSDEDARPVGWIVERLAALWGGEARWEIDKGNNPHESNHLRLDCAKARGRLGWKPIMAIAQALQWTVEWSRAFQRHENMSHVTRQQICQYRGLVEK